ncbi:MAG: SpoIID/LytB domain-containing protein [Bradymonadia bacterium]
MLPTCVSIQGECLALDEGYIAGVVQCEVAGISDAGAALEAQAIAARTYFANWYLRTKGRKQVDTTARFQCWRPPTSERARSAALSTAGIIMQHEGRPIYSNYVSGTKQVGFDCMPESPRASDYPYDTWGEMEAIYRERRVSRSRRRFQGTDWTELFVTRNEGRTTKNLKRTVMSAQNTLNRGALAQRTAICLAENLGYETEQILQYFYGQDVRLSAPIPRLDETY